jgi:hypothetical protein
MGDQYTQVKISVKLRDAPMYETADYYLSVLDDVPGQLEDMVP